jgi:hypothetical protein
MALVGRRLSLGRQTLTHYRVVNARKLAKILSFRRRQFFCPLQTADVVFMKSGLSFVVISGVAALAFRAFGLAPLADLIAVAYLAAATLTFGRPLATPISHLHSAAAVLRLRAVALPRDEGATRP